MMIWNKLHQRYKENGGKDKKEKKLNKLNRKMKLKMIKAMIEIKKRTKK